MAYDAYGRAGYGGSRLGRAGRLSGGQPVPGYDAVYYWTTGGAGAYGQVAYGGRQTVVFPVAGLFAAPDDAAAAVTIPCWWAFASYLNVSRVDAATGARTPVRGADPLTAVGTSHHNGIANPKAAIDTSGAAAAANTTLSRLTALSLASPYVTTGFRATATAAGAAGITVSDVVGATSTTYGFLMRTSAAPSAVNLSVAWYDATGTSLGTQTYPVTAAIVAASVNTWVWATVTIASWPGTAATGTLTYTASGLPAGGRLDLTERIAEASATYQGGYFDGDYPGGGWEGTPGQSYSDQAPIQYITDAEAPFDVPVFYELTNPSIPGYKARTELVTLHSSALSVPRDAVLTHPGLNLSVRVWVEAQPEITKAMPSSTFAIIGRRNPVVITDPQRKSDTGSLTFVAETLEERDRLLAMLDDGSPLLLRAPALYGHPPLWWLSFGDVKETPMTGYAGNTLRRLSADFTQVDRPSAATRPLVL
jgi:hypothetical protein